jgi:hypothetical protein
VSTARTRVPWLPSAHGSPSQDQVRVKRTATPFGSRQAIANSARHRFSIRGSDHRDSDRGSDSETHRWSHLAYDIRPRSAGRAEVIFADHRWTSGARWIAVAVEYVGVEIDSVRPTDCAGDLIDCNLSEQRRFPKRLEHSADENTIVIPSSSKIAATWPTSSSGPLVTRERRGPSRRHRPMRCRIADEPARGRSRSPKSSDSEPRSRHAQVVRHRRKAVASDRHVPARASRAKTRSGSQRQRDQCLPELLSGPPSQGDSRLRQSGQCRDAWSSSMPTTSAMRLTPASRARSATPLRCATDAIMQSIKPRAVTPSWRQAR